MVEIQQVLPRDAIPSVDDPSFVDEYFGDGDDLVVVLEESDEAGTARAYPFRILNFHEIVNDGIDGMSVAITWCPLCGSAVVYDRVVAGRELEFGVSGKLANDDLVMYDRQTDSEWKQSSGECLAGDLEGTTLEVRPAATMRYDTFRESFPEGKVLARPRGRMAFPFGEGDGPQIDYETDMYEGYAETDVIGRPPVGEDGPPWAGEDARPWDGEGTPPIPGDDVQGVDPGERPPDMEQWPGPDAVDPEAMRPGEGMVPPDSRNDRDWDHDAFDPKSVVLGIERDGEAIGFPEPVVESVGGVVETSVGNEPIVVVVAGDELYAYLRDDVTLELSDGRLVGDGTVWNPATGQSDDGRRLTRVPAKRMFAFAWQDDHGANSFWEGDA